MDVLGLIVWPTCDTASGEKEKKIINFLLLEIFLSEFFFFFLVNQTFCFIKEEMAYCRNTGTVKLEPVTFFSLNSLLLIGISVTVSSLVSLLAPLAEGQRAIVMAWGRRACVRPSVRASVNFFFKKLLLRNYWLDFNQISQECSLGGPLSNSFK